jgi:hypothetical protein
MSKSKLKPCLATHHIKIHIIKAFSGSYQALMLLLLLIKGLLGEAGIGELGTGYKALDAVASRECAFDGVSVGAVGAVWR